MSKAVRGTRKPIESTGTAVTPNDPVKRTGKLNGDAATAATLREQMLSGGRERAFAIS